MTDLNPCPSCGDPLDHPSGDGCANMAAHKERAVGDDKELIARLRDADLYNAQHYERDPLHKQAADRIEALEGKLAKAVEALEWCATVHDSSRARATLAEIKGENHE